jgi:hypothetical protein
MEDAMAEQAQRAQPKFRRVVTGHDENAKPIIWIDGEATNHKFPDDHISSTMMWSTTRYRLKPLGASCADCRHDRQEAG